MIVKELLTVFVIYVVSWLIVTLIVFKRKEPSVSLAKETIFGFVIHLFSVLAFLLIFVVIGGAAFVFLVGLSGSCKGDAAFGCLGLFIVLGPIAFSAAIIALPFFYWKVAGLFKKEGELRWNYGFAFNIAAVLSVIIHEIYL